MRARCPTGRRRRARSTSTGAAGSGCSRGGPLLRFLALRAAGRGGGHRGGRAAGAALRRGAGERAERVRRLCRARRGDGEGRAQGRWSPPGPAARASGSATCCARTGWRPRPWRTAAALRGCRRARWRWRSLGWSAASWRRRRPRARASGSRWSASRTCSASASPARRAGAAARRPVHRRRDRHRAGRPGGAPGPRHRPLRRARDHQVSGAPHDCLRLVYDGGDKLFLPVENIEVLSRFGSEAQGVALDKLGGASWQNAQGAGEAAHPGHGGAAHPRRRRAAR